MHRPSSDKADFFWVKWLRMQGHRLPATLEVTGLNPGQGKINLIIIEKNTNGIPDSKILICTF